MNYEDRFNPEDNWQKILFRPDEKTQSAEYNEIQSLINYQHTQAFTYLFNVYRIIKGLKITFKKFTSTGYVMTVESGQVFLRQNDKGYFINIEERDFEVPFNERIYLGFIPLFETLTDVKELRDPLTGGEVCGDLGAHRLIVSSELTLNQDSLPIAVIEGRGIGQYPYIFYFNKKGYSLQYDSEYVPKLIADYLALRAYEESGDFIAEGLDLTIASSNSVTITTGFAYIKGKKVDLCYPFSYVLPVEDIDVYSFYLTSFGGILVEKSLPLDKPNAIYLGLAQAESERYYTIPSKAIPLSNSDIKLLQARNILNQQTLFDYQLEKQVLDSSLINNITGTLIDSFTTLNGSDVNSFLFSASIIPKYGILRPNFISNKISFLNLQEVTNNKVQVTSKGGLPFYSTPITSENIIINQDRATSFITIDDTTSKPVIRVNPPNGQLNTYTKEFQSISEIEPYNSFNFKVQPYDKVAFQSTLQTTLVTLEGFGFDSLEDNLKIVFGNIQISEFTTIKGSQGSNNLTIKAAEDGSFVVTFNIPVDLPFKQYTITVSNFNTSSSVLFRDSVSDVVKLNYQASIAQTFTIQSEVLISKVNLALRKIPVFNSAAIDLALISIVKANGELPSNEVLGQGILKLTDTVISSDGTAFTEIVLDLPVALNSGQYALVIAPLASGQPLELYYAHVGDRSLSSTSVSNSQPLLGGELLINLKDQWVKEVSKDLTFQLVQCVASTKQADIVYRISNPLGKIHQLNREVKEIIQAGSKVEYFYKNTSGSWVIFNQSQPIQGNLSEVDIKITLSGRSSLFPLLLLNQSCFTIYENSQESTWISKTLTYVKGYKNVEVEFDYYKPIGTDISVLFSSNSGETWQSVDLDEDLVQLVNASVPIYKGTYIIKDLDPTTVSTDINGNTSRILRTKFTLKIEFTSQNPEVVPYIMKLKSVVY